MPTRVVLPQTVRLMLSEGDWIDVKERLNHGEHQEMFESMYHATERGELIRQPLKWADSVIGAYLVDWSFTDVHERPLVIRGRSRDELHAALNAIDQDSYLEIKDAIEKYVNDAAAARAEKKRTRHGAGEFLATSLSLVAAAGDTNG